VLPGPPYKPLRWLRGVSFLAGKAGRALYEQTGKRLIPLIYIMLLCAILQAPTVDHFTAQEADYMARVDVNKVTRAMRFHGTPSATFDHTTGELYFERDGQRCRLYTEAFLEREGIE
jgi:hypothetical protein